MGDALRVAVVGAGKMGSNHLRAYSTIKGVEVAGVFDVDRDRAEAAARRYGCPVLDTLDSVTEEADAASVAVPSSLHAEVGGTLLEGGVHCLIEKPLATTEADCRKLIDGARRQGLVLLVGHVERFNPVVEQLEEIVGGHLIHAIDARRMSALSARITDVDVVSDLMVHDLDIVLALMKSPVAEVYARGVHTVGAGGQDYVTAVLAFANGGLASLTASRITQNKVRELQLTTDVGFITANYTTQELLLYRQGHVAELGSGSNYVLDLAIERVFVRPGEPLVLELRHFVDAVLGRVAPRVSGEDALEALQLVWRVKHQVSGEAGRHG